MHITNRILQVILDYMKLYKPQINYLRIENDKMLIWIGKSMSYGAKSLNTTIFYHLFNESRWST